MPVICPQCHEPNEGRDHCYLCGHSLIGAAIAPTGVVVAHLSHSIPPSDHEPTASDSAGSVVLEQPLLSTPPPPEPRVVRVQRPDRRPSSDRPPSKPEPLADPLRALRTGINWLNGVTFVFSISAGCWLISRGGMDGLSGGGTIALALVSAFTLFLIANLLPNRPTDILYLRSFRTDETTGGIRTSLERAFGERMRVSGIREPKRRWPLFFRFFSYILFAFKYANPKYLNLEAGSEWRGRLWRSLGEARGVVIDISHLTPAVEAEVRLCVHCMGLRRILFVVRNTTPADEWREVIRGVLDHDVNVQELRVLHYANGPSSIRKFEDGVKEFATQLPEKAAGFDESARGLAEQLPGEVFHETNRSVAWEIAAVMIGGTVGYALLRAFFPTLVALAGVPIILIWTVLALRNYVALMRDSGSRWRKWNATAVLLFLALFTVGATWGLLTATAKVKEAAHRMTTSNQLKQLGLAMHTHNDALDRLPGANAPADPMTGRPRYPVSWRVLILPFLGHDDLFRKYRFDEPWDGPNNKLLIPLMPKVYTHPNSDPNLPAGHTHFRVFGGSRDAGLTPFTDGGNGTRIIGMTDGTSRTILVVEAAEAVEWIKPEVLKYDPKEPLPKLGGLHTGGFNAAMADGSVRFFHHEMPEANLRAFITSNGGEVTSED